MAIVYVTAQAILGLGLDVAAFSRGPGWPRCWWGLSEEATLMSTPQGPLLGGRLCPRAPRSGSLAWSLMTSRAPRTLPSTLLCLVIWTRRPRAAAGSGHSWGPLQLANPLSSRVGVQAQMRCGVRPQRVCFLGYPRDGLDLTSRERQVMARQITVFVPWSTRLPTFCCIRGTQFPSNSSKWA